MGRLKKISIYILLICIIILSSCIGYFYYWLEHPNIAKNQTVEYYVQKGSSFTKIVYDLSKQGIILHPKLFIFYSGLLKKTGHIKYGTYKFTDIDTPKSILLKLINGDTILIKITIPEGLNIYQVAQKLEKYFPTIPTQEWLNLFSDSSYINNLALNERVKNVEGFLFPQTYFFDPHPEPQFIIKSFISEFKRNVSKQMFEKAKTMGLSPLQFITLASIVEKETRLKSERSMVAAVYWNRIKKKMKLQADPTVIYGIWNQYVGFLHKKDLLRPTPYNTYTFVGLPVGPIANPGLDSILATLDPAKTDALYFVATGHGGHVFSSTLKEHNRAVQQYIQFLRSSEHFKIRKEE